LPAAAEEDLARTYAHVRRDLIRIFIIATLLFAGIYASRFFVL